MKDDAQLEKIVDAITRRLSPSPASLPENTLPYITQTTITLDAAKRLCEAVEIEAARIGVKPVVAVANAGGHTVCLHAADNSYIASVDVALSKAYTVVALKMSTSALKPLTLPGAPLHGIELTNHCRIVIFGGGEPLLMGDAVIGGLGVSGGSEEQDTYLAEYGARYFKEAMS